ncbi:hypothetical protein [Taibaiella soli]|uniref:Letm1 RBD domain-containing protein n=1 Tax=Taibaiella soli TaxID=1649169 RepID=A0A2W2BWU0_9BACT|nr:hypothetical protein [Taibaiella soli]PZF72323.1 hypothetical protein DN068_13275 [Taibaiella soli]
MNIKAIIEEHAHHFLLGIKTECARDKEAGIIIRKYISEGKISEEEDHLLKSQLMDSLKIIGIGVPFILIPGASIIMPILIKVASKHNIELMPSAFVSEKTPDK